MAEQERLAREACARHGWQIVDILRVPGHSRNYVDIHECAADMRAQGIDAFDKLLSHWKAKDFDVLVVYDADRFARTQTLHAYVTEATINMGAFIYSINDGRIDSTGYRMWIAMSGYRAASHIDRIRAAKKAAIIPFMDRGLNTNARCPITHRVVRGANGKQTHFELNPDARPLIDAAVELLLQGVGYQRMSYMLADLGFKNPATGKRFSYMSRLFHSPMFHGNLASGHYTDRGLGVWAFDPTVPPPDGVIIQFGKVPAAYEGEKLQRIQNELRRRASIGRTAWAGEHAHRFTGLIVCGYCGRRMAYHRGRSGVYYVCRTPGRSRTVCVNKQLREEVATEYIKNKVVKPFARLIEKGTFIRDYLAGREETSEITIEDLEREAVDVQARMRRLIAAQALTDDPTAAALYAEEITTLGLRTRAINADLNRLRSSPALVEANDAEEAMRAILSYEPEEFWALPDAEINRLLHALRALMVAKDSQIKALRLRKK